MPWRTSPSNGAWTPQQRAFLALAVLLFILALAICIVRLHSDAPPAGKEDIVGEVSASSG
jgi:hypothetical protein